jgi:hypothetical protein
LQVEALESRLTPIIAILVGFRPTALVVPTPEPVPPQTLVQFDPQPVLSDLGSPGLSQTYGGITIIDQGVLTVRSSFALGSVTEEQPPSPTSVPGSFSATFNLSGTERVDVFRPGSTTPLESKNATVTVTGCVVLTLQTPTPPMGQEFKYQMKWETTTVTQGVVQDNQGHQWLDLAMVSTTGSASEVQHFSPEPSMAFGPFGEISGSFAVQDQIYETLTPVTPPGVAPQNPVIIQGDALGTGNEQLVLQGPGAFGNGAALGGTDQTTWQGDVTLTFPPLSPTAPPSMVTMAFDITDFSRIDELLLNPTH